MGAMNHEERRNLLEQLQQLAGGNAEAEEDITRIFLPLPRHELALRDQIMVIRGDRGAGKTALFKFLTREQRGAANLFASDSREGVWTGEADWISGFSEFSTVHPTTAALDKFGVEADSPTLRVFWLAHLAGCLRQCGMDAEVSPPELDTLWKSWKERVNDPDAWVASAQANLGVLTGWLDSVDRTLEEQGRNAFVVYDHLDRIGLYDAATQHRFAGSLLALWMSLSNRYHRLKTKIFIREDLFEAAQRAFPDASKLKARSISLGWDNETLYRLLIRHMSALSEEVREWIQRGGNGIPLTERDQLGWMPPEALPERGKASQKALIDHLVGELMGKGIKKGYTYRWIPNRLQDAHVRVVPRSLLNLVGNAAAVACERGPRARYDRLMHPGELQAALEQTSISRVDELKEEHVVVGRLESLRGLTVLMKPDKVKRALAKRVPPSSRDDGFGGDGAAAMAELMRLGVLKARADGRIDVPDIYRYGYGIKRKGGVARPR